MYWVYVSRSARLRRASSSARLSGSDMLPQPSFLRPKTWHLPTACVNWRLATETRRGKAGFGSWASRRPSKPRTQSCTLLPPPTAASESKSFSMSGEAIQEMNLNGAGGDVAAAAAGGRRTCASPRFVLVCDLDHTLVRVLQIYAPHGNRSCSCNGWASDALPKALTACSFARVQLTAVFMPVCCS